MFTLQKSTPPQKKIAQRQFLATYFSLIQWASIIIHPITVRTPRCPNHWQTSRKRNLLPSSTSARSSVRGRIAKDLFPSDATAWYLPEILHVICLAWLFRYLHRCRSGVRSVERERKRTYSPSCWFHDPAKMARDNFHLSWWSYQGGAGRHPAVHDGDPDGDSVARKSNRKNKR